MELIFFLLLGSRFGKSISILETFIIHNFESKLLLYKVIIKVSDSELLERNCLTIEKLFIVNLLFLLICLYWYNMVLNMNN